MDLLKKLKTINIIDMDDFRIGNAEDTVGATGCTVIISEEGAVTGVDVRGGGPATRETDRLSPLCRLDYNHAVVFAGGSAYGLDASAGVMQFLEEKNIGYQTNYGLVPLVAGADIYDLSVGDPKCRPDKSMGYEACQNAFKDSYKEDFFEGNHGAGTGASVGKFMGSHRAMKSGLGTYAVQIGSLKMAAIVTVNALGDIYDVETGNLIAGVLDAKQKHVVGTESVILDKLKEDNDFYNKNTTIGCILTNAVLTNAEAAKISSMAQNGLARVIWPVHTSADGDAIFTMASGKVDADTNIIGSIVSEIMAKAINNAVNKAESAYGLKSSTDMIGETK